MSKFTKFNQKMEKKPSESFDEDLYEEDFEDFDFGDEFLVNGDVS